MTNPHLSGANKMCEQWNEFDMPSHSLCARYIKAVFDKQATYLYFDRKTSLYEARQRHKGAFHIETHPFDSVYVCYKTHLLKDEVWL
eukprot:CAMPEP_0114249560 /NCGR_PEP_ID=MMETSP0058-20121206/14209_1 /TAXON_ID=36894 /ORGANISM="Pyramimonas parkeae, CCMP726" /LENGTH=86 /DNA_ID=CAMNT_0001363117 /DNA_START=1095 /DNA_END=1355 /DNA_ORIENTATION=-